MPQHYQPGDRQRSRAQFTENRFAWCITELGQFVILVGNESGEAGQDVVLFHPRPGKIPNVSLALTRLTAKELDAFESIITSAIEWARPVVEQRDKDADNAYSNGDDSNTRNYRAVPQLVYRKRPEPEHGPSVPERPEGVPEGGGRPIDGADGRVRGAGDELAEPRTDEDEPEDNRATAD